MGSWAPGPVELRGGHRTWPGKASVLGSHFGSSGSRQSTATSLECPRVPRMEFQNAEVTISWKDVLKFLSVFF